MDSSASTKMHVDEVATSEVLVLHLLELQFPQWVGLEVKRVRSAGTDNALYRLGDEMVVRLPRTHRATGQVEKEHRWLPTLTPHLPLEIPTPLEMGQPGDGYPWHWSIYRWLKGEHAVLDSLDDYIVSVSLFFILSENYEGCMIPITLSYFP